MMMSGSFVPSKSSSRGAAWFGVRKACARYPTARPSWRSSWVREALKSWASLIKAFAVGVQSLETPSEPKAVERCRGLCEDLDPG
jgi:hypothetical protein